MTAVLHVAVHFLIIYGTITLFYLFFLFSSSEINTSQRETHYTMIEKLVILLNSWIKLLNSLCRMWDLLTWLMSTGCIVFMLVFPVPYLQGISKLCSCPNTWVLFYRVFRIQFRPRVGCLYWLKSFTSPGFLDPRGEAALLAHQMSRSQVK